jgi:hypothetical protein
MEAAKANEYVDFEYAGAAYKASVSITGKYAAVHFPGIPDVEYQVGLFDKKLVRVWLQSNRQAGEEPYLVCEGEEAPIVMAAINAAVGK